jgi:membrane-associated phospholipid phosphatase
MKESTYIQMTSALHANPSLERGINVANKLITYAIYVAYPCLIVWLFFAGGWPAAIFNRDWSVFAVPATSGGAELVGGTAADVVSGAGLLGFANAQAATPIEGPIALLYALLVPGISFVLVSVFRRIVNAPRPYEVFDGVPVIAKDTLGKSFPSRHAFSIFVIGMAFCACCPLTWAGPTILVLGVALAVIRVIAGVHFPRDAIAGALAGILLGYMGFWVL